MIRNQTDGTVQDEVVISGRKTQTIQTHNAVSVAASASSTSSGWIDCNGYNDVAMTFKSDANTTGSALFLWSNDQTSVQGMEQALSSSARQYGSNSVPVKSRYLQLQITNGDTAAHTMSAWVYLKS